MASIADDTQWLDATAQADLIAAGEITAGEMVDGAIERIERINGDLNAVIMKWYDRAREQSAGIDRRRADGTALPPFGGVPFLLKDLAAHDIGTPLTAGNVALRDAQPLSTFDTTLVARCRDAGLVTVGRTNSPELGSLPVTEPIAYGPTRNPWNPDHTPGGSSGGAAAAVASGMVPIAHASDGGGSIRIPASCSGLFGLKPTQGRITLGPDRDESALSVAFCVSRSVRDSARLLDAVHGPGVGDTIIAPAPQRPYADEVGADPGRLRIGLLDRHPLGNVLHDDCVTAVRDAASKLEALGHDVSLGHPTALEDPTFSERFMAMWSTMMALGIDAIGQTIGRALTDDDVEPVNWAQAEFARRVSGPQYAHALYAVMQYRRALHQWWADGWDLLLTPTLCEPPVKIGEMGAAPGDPMAGMKRAAQFVSYTPPFNASGQPAISVPLHWNADGLPIGVQLVAAYGRDDLLIAVGSQLEAAHPWADRRPPHS
jgi:amidase